MQCDMACRALLEACKAQRRRLIFIQASDLLAVDILHPFSCDSKADSKGPPGCSSHDSVDA